MQHFICFSDHPSSSDRGSALQLQKAVAIGIQPAPVENGFLSDHSTSPARGYFGEQGSHDTTQNTLVSSTQIHSVHSAETSSSKQKTNCKIYY